jgi:hypothetical protein
MPGFQERLRQEDNEFEASLDCIGRPILQKPKENRLNVFDYTLYL